MSDDEQAIRDLIGTWHRATASGDLPRILSPDGRGCGVSCRWPVANGPWSWSVVEPLTTDN